MRSAFALSLILTAALRANAAGTDAPPPQLSPVYTTPGGDAVVVEQHGPIVRITFRSRVGGVSGHADLAWNPANAVFSGSGVQAVPCAAKGGTAEVPVQFSYLFVQDGSTIRIRWLSPEQYDCAHAAVLTSAWRDILWARDDDLAVRLPLNTPRRSDRILIYLSAPSRAGFIDTSRAIEDSIADLRSRLSTMDQFQVVNRAADADVLLTVVARGVGSEEYGRRLDYREYYSNVVLTSTPLIENSYWVATVMQVGGYRKELAASRTNRTRTSMGAWHECANQIADDLRSWATANADQLFAQRSPRP